MLPSVQTEMFWCAWNCSGLHHFSSSVEDMEASEPSGHSWKEVGVGGGSWGKSDPDNDQSPENLCLAARRAHLHVIELWSAWQRLLWGKCLQGEAKQESGAWNPNKVFYLFFFFNSLLTFFVCCTSSVDLDLFFMCFCGEVLVGPYADTQTCHFEIDKVRTTWTKCFQSSHRPRCFSGPWLLPRFTISCVLV